MNGAVSTYDYKLVSNPDSGFLVFSKRPPGLIKYSNLGQPDTNFHFTDDGSIDPAFSTTSYLGGSIYSMLSTDFNSFYMAGSFNQVNGQSVNRIVRLKNHPCIATDIALVSTTKEISVFPNPGKDILEINLGSEIYNKAQIQMLDMHGRQILVQNKTTDSENERQTFCFQPSKRGLFIAGQNRKKGTLRKMDERVIQGLE